MAGAPSRSSGLFVKRDLPVRSRPPRAVYTGIMNTLTTIAQIASPIVDMIFVVEMGVGYYYQWKVSRKTLDEMREERISGGRPQVTVDDDYSSLPEVSIVVRNV